jgi:hypothetical protein
MDIEINDDQRTLLAWLHQNAEGYGPRHVLHAPYVWNQLGWSSPQGEKALSYLVGWGLAGYEANPTPHPSFSFCLSAAGENYVRTLEKRLKEQQLLHQAQAGLWGLIKEMAGTVKQAAFKVAGELLAEMIRTGLR